MGRHTRVRRGPAASRNLPPPGVGWRPVLPSTPLTDRCGRVAKKAPGIFDFKPDLGLKLGQTKPQKPGTLPTNRNTTIPNDCGPISACFATDPTLYNCEIAHLKMHQGNYSQTILPQGAGKKGGSPGAPSLLVAEFLRPAPATRTGGKARC